MDKVNLTERQNLSNAAKTVYNNSTITSQLWHYSNVEEQVIDISIRRSDPSIVNITAEDFNILLNSSNIKVQLTFVVNKNEGNCCFVLNL